MSNGVVVVAFDRVQPCTWSKSTLMPSVQAFARSETAVQLGCQCDRLFLYLYCRKPVRLPETAEPARGQAGATRGCSLPQADRRATR